MGVHKVIHIFIAFSCLILARCHDTLGPMNVFKDQLTMSGYSSGGTMAQMMQFSYSSMFCGVAVFSHAYYRCGPPDGNVENYDRFCTSLYNLTDSEIYNPLMVHDDIKEYFKKGLIENPSNLKGKRLYVYAGLRSFLFRIRQSLDILKVYEPYVQDPSAIMTHVQDAAQLLPSNHYGGPCIESAEDTQYIGNCGFSGVTEAINFILFSKYNREQFRTYKTKVGKLPTFDQTEFTDGLKDHNMDELGYYYVPEKCKNSRKPCYLHFYFHGCLTGREFNGPLHIENTGLLQLAERKNIIMVFPQAKTVPIQNEVGCWDTFGLSGENYATQKGPQVIAIKRMFDKILGREFAGVNDTVVSGLAGSHSQAKEE